MAAAKRAAPPEDGDADSAAEQHRRAYFAAICDDLHSLLAPFWAECDEEWNLSSIYDIRGDLLTESVDYDNDDSLELESLVLSFAYPCNGRFATHTLENELRALCGRLSDARQELANIETKLNAVLRDLPSDGGAGSSAAAAAASPVAKRIAH